MIPLLVKMNDVNLTHTTIHYTLHTTHYNTLQYTTIHYTLHTTHYTLHTTHYTLHTTHYVKKTGLPCRRLFGFYFYTLFIN